MTRKTANRARGVYAWLFMPSEDLEQSVAAIESSIGAAQERVPQHAESVAGSVALLHGRPLEHESRVILLSIEVFAGECANLAAWLLHIRGEHAHAREIVRAAHIVQKAVKEALENQ